MRYDFGENFSLYGTSSSYGITWGGVRNKFLPPYTQRQPKEHDEQGRQTEHGAAVCMGGRTVSISSTGCNLLTRSSTVVSSRKPSLLQPLWTLQPQEAKWLPRQNSKGNRQPFRSQAAGCAWVWQKQWVLLSLSLLTHYGRCAQVEELLSLVTELREEVIRESDREIYWWKHTTLPETHSPASHHPRNKGSPIPPGCHYTKDKGSPIPPVDWRGPRSRGE